MVRTLLKLGALLLFCTSLLGCNGGSDTTGNGEGPQGKVPSEATDDSAPLSATEKIEQDIPIPNLNETPSNQSDTTESDSRRKKE